MNKINKKKGLNKFVMIGLMTLICALTISGCSSNTIRADITKANSKLKTITFDTLSQKIKEKESFILMVSQTNSTQGKMMERTLVAYHREREIATVYELYLDKQGDKLGDTSDAYAKLLDIVPYFNGSVPQFFYFQKGKMKHTVNGTLSELAWQNFMITCGLVEGKKITEKNPTFVISDKGFEKKGVEEIADMFSNKASGYVYYARKDRYNEAFSKKLEKVAKENNIPIMILYEEDIILPNDEQDRQRTEAAISLLNERFDLNYSPAVYRIQDGAVTSNLKDNVSEADITAWILE